MELISKQLDEYVLLCIESEKIKDKILLMRDITKEKINQATDSEQKKKYSQNLEKKSRGSRMIKISRNDIRRSKKNVNNCGRR